MGRKTRHISARNLVNDIRRGLTRLELMDKYELTSRGLHRVFGKLVDAGAVTVGQLPEKLDSQVRDSGSGQYSRPVSP